MAFAASNFLDDLDTDPMASAAYPAVALRDEAIRKQAHIANGGEASFECPKCHGTGIYRGYARSFPCFKCNRTGRVSAREAAPYQPSITSIVERGIVLACEEIERITLATQPARKGNK